MMQIKLGSLTTFWRYIKTAEDADNGHLVITGRSGSGKTYALQMIERGIAESHEAAMIVLNFHGTHDSLREREGSGCIRWSAISINGTVSASRWRHG